MKEIGELLKGISPTTFGAYAVMAAVAGALYWGYLWPSKTVERIITGKEREVEDAKADCKFQREMNERLLAQLERTVTVAELTAATAAAKRGTKAE